MMKERIKTIYINRIINKQTPISLNRTGQAGLLDPKILTLEKTFCVINFDDLSPIPESSRFIGRGGDLNDFVSVKHIELLKRFPFLGITHFMVPQFLPSDYYNLLDKQHYSISDTRNKDWLDHYKGLSKVYNIEFASHGLYHRQFENLLFARHTEFAYLNYAESLKRINESIQCFHQAGIEPIGFRPPGWDMNSDLSLIDAIRASGLKYAALSSYDGGLNSIVQRVSYHHPVMIKGIINFPDNINLDWPMDLTRATIRKIISEKGMISIKGHFSKDTLTNSFSGENFLKLTEIIDFIQSEFAQQVEFATFRDICAELVKTDQYAEYSLSSQEQGSVNKL